MRCIPPLILLTLLGMLGQHPLAAQVQFGALAPPTPIGVQSNDSGDAPEPSASVTGSLGGTVTDAASGRPLSPAQVFIQGTGLGGLTSASGNYLIRNVPAGEHTLRVELIGYSAVEQRVTVTSGEMATVDFRMSQQALALDEVVVTGTAGQARRREVGNTISQLRMDDIRDPTPDIGQLLQGRITGAVIQMGSGNSNSGPDIRLRGNTSTALSNQPLIYIDGMRAQSEPISRQSGSREPYSPLSDLNPDDIERIEVVKGPAATTLYGTEAAAGVIQIFTKRGGQGAPQWTTEVQQGWSYFRPFGTSEVPYLWMDPVFQNGHRQRYSASVRGGAMEDVMGYFVSAAWEDNDGPVETDWLKRMNVRANTSFQARSDLLFQFNSALTRTDYQTIQTGNSVTSIIMTSIRGPQNYMAGRRDQETLRLLLDGRDYINKTTRSVNALTVNYTPGADFTHRLTVGYDFAQDDHYQNQDHCWLCPIGIMSDFSDYRAGGEIQRAYSNVSIWSLEYVGSYVHHLTDNLRSTLSFGAQGVQTENENTLTVGREFPGPGEYTLSSAALRQNMNQNKLRVITGGFFAQSMLGFSDRYFVTVGARIDGNSAFGENLGFETYPKISGSYVISDESFWPERLGEVKLRGAWGLAGRAPGAFDKVRTWNPVGFAGSEQAFYPQNLGNDDLGPERTNEIEVGLDGGWLDGRVSGEFTFYRQITTDALFNVTRPQSAGGWGAQLENVGKLQNRGIELRTDVTVLNRPSLRWDLGLGMSTNHSKVLDLGGTAPFEVGGFGWIMEGQPVPVINAFRVMNFNELADPIISSERVLYGPNLPTHVFQAFTSFGLPGGLELSGRAEYMRGGFSTNYFESGSLSRTISHPSCYDAYRKADPSWTPGALYENSPPSRPSQRPADMYAWEMSNCFGMRNFDLTTTESDFIELRDVTLSVPVSRLVPRVSGWASRMDLTISGRNLWYWTHKNLHTGHPEQQSITRNPDGSSGQFSHDMTRRINETLPPSSYFTFSLRAIF